ncbi:aminotransferase class III-fold pyridoxal phosphate-dependent enzyme [Microbacterium ulmi]|uniref:Aspartate aminotransferase family protein n=1 Tax=Microbacterium ulmi TaxID=179095 RepID=A0A7Y2Q2U0_9MICO|nr:4-aminobutyrate aminotransferase [Microbacterium ulmi]NNH05008.1 aspartate aminotransferase family protein [Microbacterium ulmi]
MIEHTSAPVLTTEVPGPRSRAVSAGEREFRAGGASAGSLWSELSIIEGLGAVIKDADGNLLIDACSGTVVMNIGHGNQEVAHAIAEQAATLTHFYDFASPVRLEFYQRLAATLPERLRTFLLLNSGAEAVEASLRIARSATGRMNVVAFTDAYHGRTLGALSLTTGSAREGMGPLLPGVVHVPTPHRFPGVHTAEDPSDACARYMESYLAQVLTGPPAAVYIEPVQGAGGTIPIPTRFLQHLRDYCDRTGALLVFDEILTGAGRTGTMWAFEGVGVTPDLLLSGKGLAGGFPFGLVAGSAATMTAGPIAEPTRNSSTFGGNQMASAAGIATLRVLQSGLVDNAREVGGRLLERLKESFAAHPLVADVRGRGLLIGVELASGTAPDLPQRVLRALLARGVVISSTGSVVRITPPLCLTHQQADVIVSAMRDALDSLDA